MRLASRPGSKYGSLKLSIGRFSWSILTFLHSPVPARSQMVLNYWLHCSILHCSKYLLI